MAAIAPFVRTLANVRKWSFRFGAARQMPSTVEWPRRTDVT